LSIHLTELIQRFLHLVIDRSIPGDVGGHVVAVVVWCVVHVDRLEGLTHLRDGTDLFVSVGLKNEQSVRRAVRGADVDAVSHASTAVVHLVECETGELDDVVPGDGVLAPTPLLVLAAAPVDVLQVAVRLTSSIVG
jgi:hypothetical protein